MIEEFFTNFSVLEWVINFALASTLLLGAVWAAEKMGVLKRPDISDMLWRFAIIGAFIAAFPTGADFGQKIEVATSSIVANVPQRTFESFPTFERVLPIDENASNFKGVPSLIGGNDAVVFKAPLKSDKNFILIEKMPNGGATISKLPPAFGGAEMKGESFIEELSMSQIGFGIWGLIASLLVLKLIVSFVFAIKSFGPRMAVSYEHRVHNLLARLCARAGVRNVPLLTTSSNIWSPACLPGNEICIPEWALKELDDDKITSLLAHEMGHIVRHDPWVILGLQFLTKIFFFQPLFWLAEKRMRSLAELGADQWAAENTKNARSLANTLFACAKKITINQQPQWGVTMATNKSELKNRIGRLVGDKSQSFKHLGRGPKTLILAGMVGLAYGLPQFQLTAIADSDDGNLRLVELQNEAHELLGGAHEKLEIVRGEMVGAQLDMAAERDFSFSSSHTDNDDGSGSFKMSGDGERIEISWDGKFTLTDNERDISFLEEDGFLEISTGRGRNKTSMEFENIDGEIVKTYFEGRKEMPFDEDAQSWLAETLNKFIQRSGVFAKERVARFLKNGGVDRVLAEIENLKTDYIVRVYGYELLDQAKLSVSEIDDFVETVSDVESDYEMRLILSQLLETQEVSNDTLPSLLKAVSTIESDYEVRTAVIPMIEDMTFDDETTAIFLDLTESIDSDYEFRVVIESAMDKANLQPVHVSRILDIASDRIESDYEMRQILSFTTNRLGGPETIGSALKAVESIGSDYEKRLSLVNIIENTELNSKLWAVVINQASTINSDGEMAQALETIAEVMPMEALLVEAYKETAEKISSKFERNKAKIALYERTN